MSKIEQIIQRKDGSEVKVVAQACFGRGMACSFNVYVLRREPPSQAWHLASDRPHPDWKSMSVDDYVAYGRSEMLRLVSTAEILKTVNALRTTMGL